MKKIAFFILTVILCSACSNSNDDDDLKMKVVYLTVKSGEWLKNVDTNTQNVYYSASFSMPEITNYIYNNGNVSVYLVGDNNQTLLPYVSHYKNSSSYEWTTTIDSNFAPNLLNIFVTSSDFVESTPASMNFRAVITW